ncbi:hypothetical protein Tco_0333338 [Tanacetum coccineum]
MVVLESCPKHNMVAYLEKTAGNAEFHEVIDFLARSSIHNALTVSPVVSTTFVEQFWMSAKSKNINNVRYITAKVAGKPVSISEASIRSDLLFDDADGIDSLPNQAIFDAIQLMGYEGDLTVLTFNKALFSPQWRFLFHTMNHCISSKSTSWDQIPTNIATASDPSPRPSPTTHIPDSIPESSGRNHRGHSSSDKSLPGNEGDMTLQSVYNLCISLCTQVTDQAKEIKHLKAQNKKLKKKAKPVITHHRAWMKSVSLKQRLQKEIHKDPLFDELADDMLDYMDTKNAQDIGRSRFVVHEEKEREEKEVSTEDVVSTDKEKVSIDRSKVSTNRSKVSTDRSRVSTDKEEVSTDNPDDQTEGKSATPTTQTPTPTTFGDDETIAQVLLNMSQAKEVSREKEKGVELKDGKKKIEEEDESDTESEGIPEAKKKFNQLARDEKMVRKVQEDWEAEEVKKLAEEEAIKTALSNKYDYIQERIEADRLLALRLQDEEREESLLWKREQSSFMIQLQLKKRKRPQLDVDSDDEHRKCLKIVTFEGTIDSEIMERKSVIARLNKYSEITLEGIELILWGDLKILMESSQEENDQSDFWDDQQDWEIVTWRLYEACGVYILELRDGTVIHMLVERRYPLSNDLLQRMLNLGLEVERESTAALDLIRFIKQKIGEE